MTEKKLIAISVLTSAIAILLVIKYGGKPQSQIAKQSYKKTVKKGMIVIRPEDDKDSYDVIYVIGGIGYANNEWISEQIPEESKNKYLFIIGNHNDSMRELESVATNYLKDNNIKVKSQSLIGFSAGAVVVLNNYSKKYKMVGLIDPSNNSSHLDIRFSNNAYIVYNPKNWGSYPNIQRNMVKIADKVVSVGGHSEKVELSHRDIPKYFFAKFVR